MRKPTTNKLRELWKALEQQQLNEGCAGGVCSISKPTEKTGGSAGNKIGKPTAISGKSVPVKEEDGGGDAGAGGSESGEETHGAGTSTHDNALFMGRIGSGVFAGKTDDVKCPKGTKKKDGVCVVKEDEQPVPPVEQKPEEKTEEPKKEPESVKEKEQEVVQFASDIGYAVEVKYTIVNKNQQMPFDAYLIELANKVEPGAGMPDKITLSYEGWQKLIKTVEEMMKVPPEVPKVPQPEQKPISKIVPPDSIDGSMVPFPDQFNKPVM